MQLPNQDSKPEAFQIRAGNSTKRTTWQPFEPSHTGISKVTEGPYNDVLQYFTIHHLCPVFILEGYMGQLVNPLLCEMTQFIRP